MCSSDTTKGGIMQVLHDEVDAAQPSSVCRIRKESPDSMSWSNMVDYMTPLMFHKLAAACSCAQMVHFLHSMNWVMDVKGASIMHFSKPMNPFSSPAEHQKQTKQLQEACALGIKLCCRQAKQQRATQFLREIPCDHQKNFAEIYLQSQKYARWVEGWGNEARKIGLKAEVEVMQGPEYAPLARTSSTIYLSVKYVQT
jgi:hypothetical protein